MEAFASNLKSPPPQVRKRINFQLIAIFCIYALVLAEGVSQVFSYENRLVLIIYGFGFSIFATIWAVHDSKLRKLNFYYPLRFVYLITCPLSTAIYLIYTRGWLGLGLIVAHFIALAVVSNIAFYVTFYAVYYSGYWDLYDPIYLT